MLHKFDKSTFRAFVFDVESIGLHGEGFSVAGGVYDAWGKAVENTEFIFACDPDVARGVKGHEMPDRDWVGDNIPPIHVTHETAFTVREAFWNKWRELVEQHRAITFAECGWPVEANFLKACIDDDPVIRNFQGPYPFHEVSTVMACAGLDPMATFDRNVRERPAHNPLADSRLSARLLSMSLLRLFP